MLNLKATIRNEEGSMIIIALPLVSLLASAVFWLVMTTQAVSVGDVTLKESNEIATRAAAKQYVLTNSSDNSNDKQNKGRGHKKDKGNGKNDVPQIKFEEALFSYEEMLQANLKLDSSLSAEKTSSMVGTPNYTLIIYNGQGSPSGIEYELKNNKFYKKNIYGNGFPKQFVLEEGVRVTLENPGTISVIEGQAKAVFGDDKNTYKRWASALIKKINGKWTVVLNGSD